MTCIIPSLALLLILASTILALAGAAMLIAEPLHEHFLLRNLEVYDSLVAVRSLTGPAVAAACARLAAERRTKLYSAWNAMLVAAASGERAGELLTSLELDVCRLESAGLVSESKRLIADLCNSAKRQAKRAVPFLCMVLLAGSMLAASLSYCNHEAAMMPLSMGLVGAAGRRKSTRSSRRRSSKRRAQLRENASTSSKQGAAGSSSLHGGATRGAPGLSCWKQSNQYGYLLAPIRLVQSLIAAAFLWLLARRLQARNWQVKHGVGTEAKYFTATAPNGYKFVAARRGPQIAYGWTDSGGGDTVEDHRAWSGLKHIWQTAVWVGAAGGQ